MNVPSGSPRVFIFPHRRMAGATAAHHVQEEVASAVRRRGTCRIIFGCAPSQDDFFSALVEEASRATDVWRAVDVFHMDDYVGLTGQHPQSFRHYLQVHFLDHIRVANFRAICGEAPSPEAEAVRYASLLSEAPIDIICMGIGENGHIAFNDPPVADFNDPTLVKVVEMDTACRGQQVNDGCFPSIEKVPRHALTITLPVFAKAGLLSCVVPTKRKAAAVKSALTLPVSPQCPATLLRTHPRASLFLDPDAASLLPPEYSHLPAPAG